VIAESTTGDHRRDASTNRVLRVVTAIDLAGTVIFTADRDDIAELAAVERRSRVEAF